MTEPELCHEVLDSAESVMGDAQRAVQPI